MSPLPVQPTWVNQIGMSVAPVLSIASRIRTTRDRFVWSTAVLRSYGDSLPPSADTPTTRINPRISGSRRRRSITSISPPVFRISGFMLTSPEISVLSVAAISRPARRPRATADRSTPAAIPAPKFRVVEVLPNLEQVQIWKFGPQGGAHLLVYLHVQRRRIAEGDGVRRPSPNR